MALNKREDEVTLEDKRMSWRGAIWDYRTLVGLMLFVVPALVVVPLLRYRTRYTVTDKRAYARYGLISRNESIVNLRHARETELSQSVIGRILGVGDIRIPTAGTGVEEVRFTKVGAPGSIREIVEDARRNLEDIPDSTGYPN